ncbi:hypothetical protein [uncultured Methanobrevibacter sp.]|uniref:hypothetical protein n=1 Tax=uncultured Methanobrevibacter sp. TaxID=253161 RepID=UPI0025CEADE5|nr:hypothetical protein [uncultured Methanobrevibacter sp.]
MDENCQPIPEVYNLINAITEYFSQTGTVYDAELTVSNNEWREISGLPGCRKRHDITFPLNELIEIRVKKDEIIFKLDNDKEHSINLSNSFFYELEYEEEYYD